jgi:parallel beta-helix repeat protein
METPLIPNPVVYCAYAKETSASGTARRNVCSANFNGIGVTNQAHPTLEANTCQENEFGINYMESAAGVARHNVCRLNREDDLYVDPSAHPILEENRTGSPGPQTAQAGSQTERTLYEVAFAKGGRFFIVHLASTSAIATSRSLTDVSLSKTM